MIIKKHSRLTLVFGIIGALTLPAGIALGLLLPESSTLGVSLAGFLCGLGSVLLAFWVIAALREKRRPGSAAEYETAQKDERGQLINGKAALAAFLATTAALIALTLYFLFAQMRLPCLLTSAVLVLQGGVITFARWHYGKKM